jgi:hypothetical protein
VKYNIILKISFFFEDYYRSKKGYWTTKLLPSTHCFDSRVRYPFGRSSFDEGPFYDIINRPVPVYF